MKKDDFKKLDEFALATPLSDGVAVSRIGLLCALRSMGNVANARKATLPVLGNVLISFGDLGCLLTVDNLDMRIAIMIDATKRESWSFLIDFRSLKNFLSVTRSDIAYFRQVNDNRVAIDVGTSTAYFPLGPLLDFPQEMTITANHMVIDDGARLRRDLEDASIFCSTEDGRVALQCVMIEIDGNNTTVVATDGKRLFVRHSAPLAYPVGTGNFCIYHKDIPALCRLLKDDTGPVHICSDNKHILFCANAVSARLKLVNASYPNYKQVIPSSFSNEIGFSAFILRWGIQSLAFLKNSEIEFCVKNNYIDLALSNPMGVEITTRIPADTGDASPNVRFCLNGKFLHDALRAGEYLKMRWTDTLSPVQLIADDTLYIIMPIRRFK